ncbi:MAG TPA: hypothetical protein V6C58_17490 [Allocoleopsis sp.]
MTTLNKWRVYCITESTWSCGYLEEGIQPTACFNNSSHTINPDSINIISTVSTSEVVIDEEHIKTGGNFRVEGRKFTINPNTTNFQEVSWPYPISVLSTFFTSDTSQKGDVVNVIVSPDTLIGTVSENVNSTNVIKVSQTVIDNIKKGYELILQDNNNYNNIGEVIDIDTNTKNVTVSGLTENQFSSGSLVKFQVRMMKNFEIGDPFRYANGISKIGGAYIPANTIVKVIYTNTSNSIKTFVYHIEYLY